MKKGLVLEGGGHRGIFTAGVLDVFLENNISFDGVIGVSAGAVHGASFLSKQKGRSLRYALKYCNDKRYMGLGSLLKTGDYFNVDFCYYQLPQVLDPFDNETFENQTSAYYTVSTDVNTGEAVYHQCKTLRDDYIKWIVSSASMPLVARIVEIDGQKLLDGGVADSIPEAAFRKMGYTKNVVILTQPKGYEKSKNSMLPLIKRIYKKYPKFVEAVENRHAVYNQELRDLENLEKTGDVFVLRPKSELIASRTERNPEKMQETYNQGRILALEEIEKIKEFLKI
ncbi:MAG: patatin family protein [Treponemataceae bacterium]|nr:patatin family protein [Treponemataceae bacterium]